MIRDRGKMPRPSLFQRIALIIVGSLIAFLGIYQTIVMMGVLIIVIIGISIFVLGLLIILAGILR